MNNEHDYKQLSINDATHTGHVWDMTRTKEFKGIAFVRANKSPPKYIFTSRLITDEPHIIQREVYLVEGENYWYVPGTSQRFSKVDGELFILDREHLFQPFVLKLNTVMPL